MPKFKLTLLSAAILTACTSNGEVIEHNYHEIKDKLISWDDIFIQKEDSYLIYFYSERCIHCNEIKQEIISFFLEDITTMYFVCTNIKAEFGPTKELNGIDSINDFYIFGTPFLLELKNHIVEDYYAGVNEVKDRISILKYLNNKIE